jgi:hypothetical protein
LAKRCGPAYASSRQNVIPVKYPLGRFDYTATTNGFGGR